MLHSCLSRLSASTRFSLGYFPVEAPHFTVERDLLRGKKIKTLSSRQSVLFFTVHKAASAYMGEMLKFLCQEAGLAPVNLMGFLSINNIPEQAISGRSRLYQSFHPHGFYYGPLRKCQNLPGLDHYKIILLLRDPRDTLTSFYYSRAYSHVLENEYNRRLREATLRQSIDDFCLQIATNRKVAYEEYLRALIGKPNMLLLKYEDMVVDFPAMLDRIITFLGYTPSAYLKQALLNEANFQVEKEDIYAHKRQVAPGDHRRKLKPETIATLNSKFAEILKCLDYPLG